MVTIEELKQNFIMRNVAPYGTCVCVPNKEFKSEWEKQLQSQGFKVFHTFFDGAPFVLVQLKKAKTQIRVGRWSKNEEERLLKRMQELPGTLREKCLKLITEFPGRTPDALRLKYNKLKRQRKSLQKELKPVTSTTSTLLAETSAHGESAGISAVNLDQMRILLEEIRDLLKPKSFSFNYVCKKCGYFGSVDDEEKIWRFCPLCGETLDVWNVEAFE